MAQIASPVAGPAARAAPSRERPTGGRRQRALVRRPAAARGHHGLPVLLDADDVAQGPGRPDLLDPAAVPPERPDARRLQRASSSTLPIPTFFLNSLIVAVAVRAAQRAGRGDGRVSAGEDAVPRPRRDLLRAARDADRAGPADLHPELRAGGQRLPLLRHAAGADPARTSSSAFNIFLLRQAFRGVPNDLIDAARVDGAGEWRIWWSDPAADRPAVAGRGRDLHVRHVVERLPVAVADAPHAGRA